ncbi:MAG: hypothetical protein HY287_01155 [Planctomycetes bacterium]|nr:hypothetical protein [Planctomycetota bacterium]
MIRAHRFFLIVALLSVSIARAQNEAPPLNVNPGALEKPARDPWLPRTAPSPTAGSPHCGPWERGPFRSIQVNVDSQGCDIVGDAANEPSIAIDPTNPDRIVIGWRQFDSIASDFRQHGYAYSHDGGETWTFPGSLAPGQFGSDPVLASDPSGNFFYFGLDENLQGQLFKSQDAGITWSEPTRIYACDKPWMTIDQGSAAGKGNIYASWRADIHCVGEAGLFARSFDAGATFKYWGQIALYLGTMAVGSDGTVYNSSADGSITKITNAVNPAATSPSVTVLGTAFSKSCSIGGINGDGLTCQSWVALDPVDGPNKDTVYALISPFDGVYFAKRTPGSSAWSGMRTINTEKPNTAYWFGTMSVAPNGRIDVIWNESSQSTTVMYSYSADRGDHWTTPIPVTPQFYKFAGIPNGQNKIGDYYHMVSRNEAAYLAYAATFNGGEDIYLLKIPPDCNANGVLDADETSLGLAPDCDGNLVPDECDPDCDGNGIPDTCDLNEFRLRDCNHNLIPDQCESCPSIDRVDCNGNCRLDSLDLSGAGGVQKFVGGFLVPEDIVASVPPYPPGYYMADRDAEAVIRIKPDGSTEVFAQGFFPTGVLFVPDGFNGKGPQLLAISQSGACISQISPTGEVTPIPSIGGCLGGVYVGSEIGGPYAGRVIVTTYYDNGLYAVNSSGGYELIARAPSEGFFFGTIVPSGFGNYANHLFVGEANWDRIWDLNLHWGDFRAVLDMRFAGVRQIAFTPSGWGACLDPELQDSPAMLVSVDAGSIQAVTPSGRIVASLSKGPSGAAINPRGLLIQGHSLFFSDLLGKSVLQATSDDFGLTNCNGNSKPDVCEVIAGSASDCNGNMILDGCELTLNDCNHNGIHDACEIRSGSGTDCDDSHVLDSCELPGHDCNQNQIYDACETGETLEDCNHDTIPDQCQIDFSCPPIDPDCPCDADCDGVTNWEDICPCTPRGLPVLSDGRATGDFLGDCVVDLLDFNAFVGRYLHRGGPGVKLSASQSFDFDRDGDVDLHDYQSFLLAFEAFEQQGP